MKQLKYNRYSIAVVGITILYLFLCLYRITDIPIGYNVDEAGTAIDAYYLANFGVDRYGVQFPVYFENYGGGQNALNQYLCAIMVKIFGFNIFWLKVPGVILNVIGLMLLIKLFKELFSKKTALIVGLIYQISPYSIMRQRTILESNLAMPIMIVALYYTYKAIYDKKLRYWQISGILYGLVLWAYMYELLVLAIFLITCFIYCMYHKKINLKQQMIFIISLLIVTWPLILFNIINIFDMNTLKIGVMTIPNLKYYRQSELTSYFGFIDIVAACLVYFTTQFYADFIQYNSGVFGVYYLTTQLIALYQIVIILKNLRNNIRNVFKSFNFKFLICTLLLCNFMQSILSLANCNKLSVQYIAIMMLLAMWVENYKKLQNKRNILKCAIITSYAVLFLAWQITYYQEIQLNGKIGDYSFASYEDILEENDISDNEFVYTTESAESFILQSLFNSYKNGNDGLDIIKYMDLNKDNFRISNQRLISIIPGKYIIRTYYNDNKDLIERLDDAVDEGLAYKKVYKYYNYYVMS